MIFPSEVPELGFYYHYKHDPDISVNNYAYEVMGVGVHTEDNCRPEDANMVVYRPLYKLDEFEGKRFFLLRPLEMFMENVAKDSKTFPRFKKITDSSVIELLVGIRDQMYPQSRT